jgi:uncharacterized protein
VKFDKETHMPANRKLFVNLAVEDLDRGIEFFARLGFEFEEAFTDATATCMLIGEDAYAMLLVKSRFAEFANKQMCDPSTHAETILGISADTGESVDELVDTTLGAGGRSAGEPQDHGFMYARSFHDPDGHHWEVVWMDPAVIAEALEGRASAG